MFLLLRAVVFALLLPGTVLVVMPLWLWSLDGPAADDGYELVPCPAPPVSPQEPGDPVGPSDSP